MGTANFTNPFRPGAGHMPPYLAGRDKDIEDFLRLLGQSVILENLVLTGLRGVGKTVLLDTFKPYAIEQGWMWVGTDLSEAASINESVIATRLITDLSVVTSNVVIDTKKTASFGFNKSETISTTKLTYGTLVDIYNAIPGLISDKLKGLLEFVWANLKSNIPDIKGLIFAYDETQTMSNYPKKDQYPLSLLLDVFQSLQKKNIPFMLVLAGLPTLFPKLVEARTFAERMFTILFLDKLNRKDSLKAITEPIEDESCPVGLSTESVELIIDESKGYPYFIQFICKEVYDVFLQQHQSGTVVGVPFDEITRKLDNDFFAGRWARASDRQRNLLTVIAELENNEEFSIQEIVEASKGLKKPFGDSQVSQMLVTLSNKGLIYKNRHGKYSFAVPLLSQFIMRQIPDNGTLPLFP